MSKPDKVIRSRFGGIAVLIVAAVTAAAAVVIGLHWRHHSSGADITQPMELRGRWLGMQLTGVDSATARQLGIPPSVKGVVVADLAHDPGSRGVRAGIHPGDVVTRVDGKAVTSLKDLYSLTTDLNVARPLIVNILRRGQPLAVLLPGPSTISLQQAGGPTAPAATSQWNTSAAWP